MMSHIMERYFTNTTHTDVTDGLDGILKRHGDCPATVAFFYDCPGVRCQRSSGFEPLLPPSLGSDCFPTGASTLKPQRRESRRDKSEILKRAGGLVQC